jgi:hypothetical protein
VCLFRAPSLDGPLNRPRVLVSEAVGMQRFDPLQDRDRRQARRLRRPPTSSGRCFHTAAYWLMLSLRGLAPETSFWRDAQFDTIRLCLIKVAGRVTEMVTRIKIALPSAFPYQAGFADLAGRIAKLPP